MGKTKTIDGDQQDLKVGRLINDYFDRKERGEAESEEEFLAAHPDLADRLRMCLRMACNLRASVITIGTLIEREVLKPNDDPGYPARLRHYKIAAVVGEGATGIVLKAYEPHLDRVVALKVLRPEIATTTSALTRFHREAKAAAALRHPNIVTVHDLDQEGGVHYVAMEYIPTTLSALIHEHGPLPTDAVRGIFRQLLSGLTVAHEAGLIHRDIKPSNILIDCGSETGDEPEVPATQSSICNLQSSIAKIADFGLVRTISAQTTVTAPGSVLGTLAYMSPEQAGAKNLNHSTDLYSAGVVLYEMLTGKRPFNTDSFPVLKDSIIREEPTHPGKLNKNADPYLASLALRLMAKKPEDRFKSASEALAALEADEPIIPPPKPRRWRKRVAIGIAVTVLLCGGVWLLSQFGTFTQRQVVSPDPTGTAHLSIADVRVHHEDGEPTTIVSARYGEELTWCKFKKFPDELSKVAGVSLVDLDGKGTTCVVAGVFSPMGGKCLFAFDPDTKEEIWSKDLSSDIVWPDCAESQGYGCCCLTAGDLDGHPGDEIVVATGFQHQYPTRVSVIDPRTEELRSTFWHMGGGISLLHVAPDFLGPGRPAIIAVGLNNKLDGFRDESDTDAVPLTCWDKVNVVMVLDPENMDGLGPPRTDRVPEIPPVQPWAYAFLDLAAGPYDPDVCDGHENPRFPQPEEIGRIGDLKIKPCTSDEHGGFCIMVSLKRPSMERGKGDGLIIVDHNLEFRANLQDRSDVHTYWRPIIQNGEYIFNGPARRPGASAMPQDGQGP